MAGLDEMTESGDNDGDALGKGSRVRCAPEPHVRGNLVRVWDEFGKESWVGNVGGHFC